MLERAGWGGEGGGSCALRRGPVPGPEVLSSHLSQRVGTLRGMSPPHCQPRAVPAPLPMQLLWIFLLGLRGATGMDPGTPTGVLGQVLGNRGFVPRGSDTPWWGRGPWSTPTELPALRGAAKTLIPRMHSPRSSSKGRSSPRHPAGGLGGHREPPVLGTRVSPPRWEGRGGEEGTRSCPDM